MSYYASSLAFSQQSLSPSGFSNPNSSPSGFKTHRNPPHHALPTSSISSHASSINTLRSQHVSIHMPEQPPGPGRPKAHITSIPPELLLNIAMHLPLQALAALLASSPRRFRLLHGLTMRNRGFCPWRRRLEAHRRYWKSALWEAEGRAAGRERERKKKILGEDGDVHGVRTVLGQDGDVDVFDVDDEAMDVAGAGGEEEGRADGANGVNGAANGPTKVGVKSSSELIYEYSLTDVFSDLGLSPPPAADGSPRFYRPCLPELLRGIANICDNSSDTTKHHLKLQKLSCDLEAVKARLNNILDITTLDRILPLPTPLPDQPTTQTSELYTLLTRYLLFSKLRPSQLLTLLVSCPPDHSSESSFSTFDNAAAINEFLSLLTLYLTAWDSLAPALPRATIPELPPPPLVAPGEPLPPIIINPRAYRAADLFDAAARRMVISRLSAELDSWFATVKPRWVDRDKSVVEVEGRDRIPGQEQGPAQTQGPGARRGTMGKGKRALSAYSSSAPMTGRRYGNFKRSLSLCDTDGNRTITDKEGLGTADERSKGGSEGLAGLTDEQRRMVETDLRPGELLKVRAYAGTGKTRSLVEYARARPRQKLLYIAFNKSAATDAARKFGSNVDCKTIHALALRVLSTAAPAVCEAMGDGRMPIPDWWSAKDIVKFLALDKGDNLFALLANPSEYKSLPTAGPTSAAPKKPPTPNMVATAIKTALENFWASASPAPLLRHLPTRLISQLALSPLSLLAHTKAVWTAILAGAAPWLPHDAYVKLFALAPDAHGVAFGRYGVILFDEAQDASACMAELIMAQCERMAGKKSVSQQNGPGNLSCRNSVIVVGDPYQKIYGFRGAGNAIFDDARFPPDHTRHLTHSFRFGAEIAQVANVLLGALREEVPVSGVRPSDKVLVEELSPPRREAVVSQDIDDIFNLLGPEGRTGPQNLQQSLRPPGAAAGPLTSPMLSGLLDSTINTISSPTPSIPEFPPTPSVAASPRGPQHAFVFRRNATLVSFFLSFAVQHPRTLIHLRTTRHFTKSTLFSQLRNAFALYHPPHTTARSGPLSQFRHWEALKEYVESTTAHLTGESPVPALIAALEPHISDPDFLNLLDSVKDNVLEGWDAERADVVFVTAHQAKGLEWDHVQVSTDFTPEWHDRSRLYSSPSFSSNKSALNAFWSEELCMLYVAVTRARKTLHIPETVMYWLVSSLGGERCIFVNIPAPLRPPPDPAAAADETVWIGLICDRNVPANRDWPQPVPMRIDPDGLLCFAHRQPPWSASMILAGTGREGLGEAGEGQMERRAWENCWEEMRALEEGWVGLTVQTRLNY